MGTLTKLLGLTLCFAALSGCFSPETACHYFELKERNLYNHTWKVDSFLISVLDSSAQYSLDTVFINDGTWDFLPDDPYDCDLKGKIRFTRASGHTVFLPYQFSTSSYHGEFHCINLSNTDSLDGMPEQFEGDIETIFSENKVLVGPGWDYYYCGGYRCKQEPQFYRGWRFVLRKQQ